MEHCNCTGCVQSLLIKEINTSVFLLHLMHGVLERSFWLFWTGLSFVHHHQSMLGWVGKRFRFVPFMAAEARAEHFVARHDGFKVLKLPYKSAAAWASCSADCRQEEVGELRLPKFKLSFSREP